MRFTPINRPEPRSIKDIKKYGMLSSEEQRIELDLQRKVRTFRELTRVEYDKPRMKVILAWYERDLPMASSLEHHHLLRAYAKCQLGDKAAAHISRMRGDGCVPDAAHCNLAVLACAQYGSAESAAQLLSETREAGLQVNPATYNAAILACALSEHPAQGWQLLLQMQADGLQLDRASYIGGITACVRDHQPQRSLRLLAEMVSAGLGKAGLLGLYNEAITASAHACQPFRATQLLADARVAGVEPDELSYDPAIEVCAREGQTSLALQVLADMRAAGMAPSKLSRDALIGACARDAMPERALELLDDTVACGLTPSAESFHLTILAGAALEVWREAAVADVLYATAVRTGAISLWTSRRQASLLHHNRESMKAAVRCALRDFNRLNSEESQDAVEKLVLFTAPPDTKFDLKRLEQNLEHFVKQLVEHFDRRLRMLHAHLAHLAAQSSESPMVAIQRRADGVVAARESVAALGQGRGTKELRAAIAGVHAVARDADEEALGTYQNVDIAVELTMEWLERLEQAESNLYPQTLDYLEELGLAFRCDRVGRGWLAVEVDTVAAWCAKDSAPQEVRSGSGRARREEC